MPFRAILICFPRRQIRQFEQIVVPEEASAGGDFHERIRSSGIRTVGQNRLQMAFRVVEIDTILAPVLAVLDQLKLAIEQRMERMGYAETPVSTALTRCI